MNDGPTTAVTLADIRARFPGAEGAMYLETSARGLVPAIARQVVDKYLQDCVAGSIDKKALLATIERVRAKFALLIHADVDEVAITKNVSEGINAFAASIPWKQGDNAVLCGEIDHPNCVYALYNIRDREGIEVRSISARAYREPVERIIAALDDRTKLIVASSVPYTTGLRTDLNALGSACRERGILFLVDGAQSVGALDIDVHREKLDGLAVSSSKYLCGFYGLGFLFVRRSVADRMQPAYLARYGVDLGNEQHGRDQGGADYTLMRGARRFDLGAYNFAAASAIECSLDLLLEVGTPTIERHVLELARSFAQELKALGFPVIADVASAEMTHVVLIGGQGSQYGPDALQQLHEHLIARGVKVSLRSGRLRFSFHFYNTTSDVTRTTQLIRTWVQQR